MNCDAAFRAFVGESLLQLSLRMIPASSAAYACIREAGRKNYCGTMCCPRRYRHTLRLQSPHFSCLGGGFLGRSFNVISVVLVASEFFFFVFFS